jgi:hypothetical protein
LKTPPKRSESVPRLHTPFGLLIIELFYFMHQRVRIVGAEKAITNRSLLDETKKFHIGAETGKPKLALVEITAKSPFRKTGNIAEERFVEAFFRIQYPVHQKQCVGFRIGFSGLFDTHGIIVAVRCLADKPAKRERAMNSPDFIFSLFVTDAVVEISTSIASRSGAYIHLVASTHVETVCELSLRNADKH